MITFFRRIRQRLLSENKISKYLIYAIGEITLVMIGILLALQVNNWNEAKKAKESEINLYKNAIEDVILETKNINTQIRWFKDYQDTNYQLYKESIGEIPYKSELYGNSLIWTNISRPLIQENYAAKVGGMTNKLIQELFRDYIWREKLAMDAKQEFNDFKFGVVRPFLAKHGIYDNNLAFNDKPYSFNSLSENGTILNINKLRAQYGTVEFDQILYGLRHSTSWYLHVLNNQLLANNKLMDALEAYMNEDFEKLNTIKSLNSYY
jgi:hypothetical protein